MSAGQLTMTPPPPIASAGLVSAAWAKFTAKTVKRLDATLEPMDVAPAAPRRQKAIAELRRLVPEAFGVLVAPPDMASTADAVRWGLASDVWRARCETLFAQPPAWLTFAGVAGADVATHAIDVLAQFGAEFTTTVRQHAWGMLGDPLEDLAVARRAELNAFRFTTRVAPLDPGHRRQQLSADVARHRHLYAQLYPFDAPPTDQQLVMWGSSLIAAAKASAPALHAALHGRGERRAAQAAFDTAQEPWQAVLDATLEEESRTKPPAGGQGQKRERENKKKNKKKNGNAGKDAGKAAAADAESDGASGDDEAEQAVVAPAAAAGGRGGNQQAGRGRGRGGANRAFQGQCFHCGETGHRASDNKCVCVFCGGGHAVRDCPEMPRRQKATISAPAQSAAVAAPAATAPPAAAVPKPRIAPADVAGALAALANAIY